MNDESWGFYVPLEEEYLIKEKKIDDYNIDRDINDDIYVIRTQATFYESVCGVWKLICFIMFRNR